VPACEEIRKRRTYRTDDAGVDAVHCGGAEVAEKRVSGDIAEVKRDIPGGSREST
jgi:hypothetical protein